MTPIIGKTHRNIFRTTVRSRTESFTFRMCAMLLDMPDRNTSLRRYKNSEHLLAVFFAGCPGVMMFMLYLMYPIASCPLRIYAGIYHIASPALSHRHLYRKPPIVSRPLRTYAGTYPIVSPALSRRHLYMDVAHSQPSAQDLERTSSIRAWRMAEIMTSIANSISSREGTEGATRMLLSISSSL